MKGAGAQHIAVATNDIVQTVTKMRNHDVAFLYIPSDYYDTVGNRVGDIEEDLASLKSLGILVDRDEDGCLLQIFTKPLKTSAIKPLIVDRGLRSALLGSLLLST